MGFHAQLRTEDKENSDSAHCGGTGSELSAQYLIQVMGGAQI